MQLMAKTRQGYTLSFDLPKSWTDLVIGESVSTNGVCLTVVKIIEDKYICVAVPETIDRTSFKRQLPGKVNLERAVKISGRLDGHLVQGHVDGIGKVTQITNDTGKHLSVSIDNRFRENIIYKGSITLDGVSLTISEVNGSVFRVAIIPYTLENTTLGMLEVNDEVNIEFDVIGKYVVNTLEIHREELSSSGKSLL